MRILLAALSAFFVLSAFHAYASQSTITVAEGYACMGEDKSRRGTEQAAVVDAKRKAAESVSTYIKGATVVKDYAFANDIVAAYANADVKVIEELEKGWYKNPDSGDCYKIKIKAEVVPDQKLAGAADNRPPDSVTPLLHVKIWTDKREYRNGEKMKVYLSGNKPFYAKVVYYDVDGGKTQLLPNPLRRGDYFKPGVMYEVPSDEDRFDIIVTPPFGTERVVVYASSAPLGEIDAVKKGNSYDVKNNNEDIALKTRGVKISEREQGIPAIAEFTEETAILVKTSN